MNFDCLLLPSIVKTTKQYRIEKKVSYYIVEYIDLIQIQMLFDLSLIDSQMTVKKNTVKFELDNY